MPHMRQIGTDENNVPIRQRADVIPHHPMPAALNRQGELKFRMEMPARPIVQRTHRLAVERLPLTFGDFLEYRLHWGKVVRYWILDARSRRAILTICGLLEQLE